MGDMGGKGYTCSPDGMDDKGGTGYILHMELWLMGGYVDCDGHQQRFYGLQHMGCAHRKHRNQQQLEQH